MMKHEQIEVGDVLVHINSGDKRVVESINALGIVLINPSGVGRLFFSHEVVYMVYRQYRIHAKRDSSLAKKISSSLIRI